MKKAITTLLILSTLILNSSVTALAATNHKKGWNHYINTNASYVKVYSSPDTFSTSAKVIGRFAPKTQIYHYSEHKFPNTLIVSCLVYGKDADSGKYIWGYIEDDWLNDY